MPPVERFWWAFHFIVCFVLVPSTKQHTSIFMVDEQLQAIKKFSIIIILFQICRKFLRRKFSELWNKIRQVSRFTHNRLNYPGSPFACLSTGHNYASSSLLILIYSRNFVRNGPTLVLLCIELVANINLLAEFCTGRPYYCFIWSFVQALVHVCEAFSVDLVTLFLNLSGNSHSCTYLFTTGKYFLYF